MSKHKVNMNRDDWYVFSNVPNCRNKRFKQFNFHVYINTERFKTDKLLERHCISYIILFCTDIVLFMTRCQLVNDIFIQQKRILIKLLKIWMTHLTKVCYFISFFLTITSFKNWHTTQMHLVILKMQICNFFLYKNHLRVTSSNWSIFK